MDKPPSASRQFWRVLDPCFATGFAGQGGWKFKERGGHGAWGVEFVTRDQYGLWVLILINRHSVGRRLHMSAVLSAVAHRAKVEALAKEETSRIWISRIIRLHGTRSVSAACCKLRPTLVGCRNRNLRFEMDELVGRRLLTSRSWISRITPLHGNQSGPAACRRLRPTMIGCRN